MADIDKVLKGLDICAHPPLGRWCKGCPYFENASCNIDLMTDALELLKERVKTKVVFGRNKDGSFETECGNCGTYLDKAYSRCPKCNRELDWNSNQT